MWVTTCSEHVIDCPLVAGYVRAVTLVTLVTLILKNVNSLIYGLVLFRNTVTSVTSVTSHHHWPDLLYASRVTRGRYSSRGHPDSIRAVRARDGGDIGACQTEQVRGESDTSTRMGAGAI